MASRRNQRLVGTTIAVATALLGSAAFAQTSELYLNDWQTTTTWVVQNGAIVRQFNRSGTSDGPGLVVQSSIKCIGQDAGQTGREYDLNGSPLSGTYLNPSYSSLYDGATDGTNNWSVAHNDFNTNFAVVQGDADWQNLQVLFVPARRSSGIAYDANSNTLWLCNNVGGSDRVQQYDFSGNLISEFPVNISGGGYAMAWDPADDTLWIPGAFSTAGHIYQYSKAGSLLQDVAISALGNVLGAEFGAGGGGFTLRVSGTCPGRVTVDWAGAAPRSTVALIFARNTGSFVIPFGPCQGTVLGLGNQGIRLVNTFGSDTNGGGSRSGNAGTAACRGYLQMHDIPACTTSNVAQLP